MPRHGLRRSLPFLILASLVAPPLAMSAGPERGKPASATCGVQQEKIDPVRAALFAQCVSGSDDIARPAAHSFRASRATVVASDRGCRAEARAMPSRHAVCYAAILPLSGDTIIDK